MDTKKFRTKQEYVSRKICKGEKFVIGLDAGYSSMKVFFENGYFCFPSYAKRLDYEMLSIGSDRDILYKDYDSGEIYMLGYTAQDMIGSGDTNDTDGEMFSRKRYSNKRFRILCHAAIAIAIDKKNDNRDIVVQTGLPSSYVKADSGDMKKAIATPSKFSLKIGRKPWKEYNLHIDPSNVFCDLAQPQGSLFSVMIAADEKGCHYVKNAFDYLTKNTLVLDIGFGTFDFLGIKNRSVVCKDSIDEIGMREVLSHTSKKILDDLNEDIRVQALQKNLETGTVTCVDEENMRTDERAIGYILEAANNEVFEEAFEKAKSITNTFRDYKYIVITGGTGDAWKEKIKDKFKNMSTMEIVDSNRNDLGIPMIYSNVRGYYLYRCLKKN